MLIVLANTRGAISAPVDAANAACRSAIAKNASKLGQAIMKAFDGCIKAGLKNGSGDCTTVALADLKGKVPTAAAKLTTAISTSCNDFGNAVALAEHLRCGPPIGTSPASFADVDSCLNQLVSSNIEALRNAILSPVYALAQDTPSEKCINAIAKSATKIFKTVQKEKTKAIGQLDKSGGDSDYTDPGDPSGKIANAIASAQSSIQSACGTLNGTGWGSVGTCATHANGAVDCVIDKVLGTASGLAASMYDQPGTCPAAARMTFLDAAEGGIVYGNTELDYGWPGHFHDLDSTSGGTLGVDLGCGAPANNDCSSCTFDVNCDAGNCRCDNDESLVCDEPFGPDADDCGGNPCIMYWGPPSPLDAGALPLCIVNTITQPMITGTLNIATGAADTTLMQRTKIHLGMTQIEPCPICVSGTCSAGERAGQPCTVNATSDFGDVSYDCQPSNGLNISGSGWPNEISLTTATASVSATLACDPPFGSENCACSVCSLDPLVPCTSDADCAAASAGICVVDGTHPGDSRQRNSCSDATCTPAGGDEGECLADEDFFCDGLLRGDDSGYLSCNTNSDCDAYFPGAGACTLSKFHDCFLDPIVASGNAGPHESTLAGVYCAVPTSNGAINSVFGLPGPVRVKLDTQLTALCSDGLTPWGPGGGNCP